VERISLIEEKIGGETLDNYLFMDQVDGNEKYARMFSSAVDLQWIATNSKAETTIEKNNRYTHGFRNTVSSKRFQFDWNSDILDGNQRKYTGSRTNIIN